MGCINTIDNTTAQSQSIEQKQQYKPVNSNPPKINKPNSNAQNPNKSTQSSTNRRANDEMSSLLFALNAFMDPDPVEYCFDNIMNIYLTIFALFQSFKYIMHDICLISLKYVLAKKQLVHKSI